MNLRGFNHDKDNLTWNSEGDMRLSRDILSFVLFIVIEQSASQSNLTDGQALLDAIFNGYDKKIPPNFDKTGVDRRVDVEVNVFINSMYSVRESSMDYSLSMFLRERWRDSRLQFARINDLNLTRIELDNSLFHKVWVPDMYILNEKSSHFHDVTVPNKLIHIYPDGTVQYSTRVTGVFSCLMFLQKYPFDTQECTLELESYGHSTETIDFYWSDNPVSLTEGIKFPEFELVETLPYTCSKDYYGIIYPCIGVKFELERSYGYYIIQIYVPSILIVVLSWVNFWLDCTSVPARISLGLLTVLTMTTQSSGARADLPRVSYVKAIDVWMAVCLAFVFLGLVEFAYVNVHSRRKVKRALSKPETSEKKDSNSNFEFDISDITTTENSTKSSCFSNLSGIDRARAADKLSRILFPAAFLIFNVIYWLVYFLWTPNREGKNLYQ